MTRLRGLAVWLTAVMTMAAGFPQSVCACAGRPATSAESAAVQACPCGGGCCASAATARCCDRDREPAQNEPSPESGQSVCQKVLLAQHAQVLQSANGVGPRADSVSWAAVSPDVFCQVPPVALNAVAWQLPSHAPPTDLLLLLQHLLI
jgi:hypothetical protein